MKKLAIVILAIIALYHYYPKLFLEKTLNMLYQNEANVTLAEKSIDKDSDEYVNKCSFAQRYLYAEARSSLEVNCVAIDNLLDSQQSHDLMHELNHVSGRVFIDYVIKQEKIADKLPATDRRR